MSELLHWVRVSDDKLSVHMTEAKFLLLEVCTTTLSPSIWQLKLVPIPKAKFLLLEVSSTILSQISDTWSQYTSLRPSIYCKRSVLLHWVPVSHTMTSVHITEVKYLLLEVSTTTSSPSFWHMKSVNITEAKILLLEVTSTTLSPSFWHHDVSTLDWGKVSTARGQYYYIESNYLTHEVSTHHWGQGSTARGLYYYIESQFLTPGCQYTSLRQRFYCLRSQLVHWVPVSDTKVSVNMAEARFLLLEVCTTTLSPSIWHMK